MECFKNCWFPMLLVLGAFAILAAGTALLGVLFGPAGGAGFVAALFAIGGLFVVMALLGAAACALSCALNTALAGDLQAAAEGTSTEPGAITAGSGNNDDDGDDGKDNGDDQKHWATLMRLIRENAKWGFVVWRVAAYANWDRIASYLGV